MSIMGLKLDFIKWWNEMCPRRNFNKFNKFKFNNLTFRSIWKVDGNIYLYFVIISGLWTSGYGVREHKVLFYYGISPCFFHHVDGS